MRAYCTLIRLLYVAAALFGTVQSLSCVVLDIRGEVLDTSEKSCKDCQQQCLTWDSCYSVVYNLVPVSRDKLGAYCSSNSNSSYFEDSPSPSYNYPNSAERHYYIAATLTDWNYAPSGRNLCTDRGELADGATYLTSGQGSVFAKARFLAYTDDTFKVPVERPEEWTHLGILGPLIRAEVADTIVIHFHNKAPFAVGINPTGAIQTDGPAGLGVDPNATATYVWEVPEAAGPGPNEAPSKLWVYNSNADESHSFYGLVGPLLVVAKGQANEDGSPKNVDRELITLFQVFNENTDPVQDDQAAGSQEVHCTHSVKGDGSEVVLCPKEGAHDQGPDVSAASGSNTSFVELTHEDFEETNMKHSINGFIFCNAPGLNMTVGERVVWHTAVVGNEVDLHSPHWHGLVFTHKGRQIDSLALLPGSAASMETVVDNAGTWMLHCHVNDHLSAGMVALFHVAGESPKFQKTGQERVYYVAAEMVEWDYTPQGGELCDGRVQPFGKDALVFVEPAVDRVGSKYIKARYVEYTDDTFQTPKERSAAEEHLGLLGPILRGSVGDVIKVHFFNRLSDMDASLHPHGVRYSKANEGNHYNDGSSGNDTLDDAVAPGDRYTYVWEVPQRAGPASNDPSSIVWMYHSHVIEAGDTYAGLTGAIVISSAGHANKDGTPKDVDREFVLLFEVSNEMGSTLWPSNLDALKQRSEVDENIEADEDFQESNLMHNINGFMYCNLPGFTAVAGERVRMYVLGMGTEVDLHAPKISTAMFDLKDSSAEAITLLPGVMRTADVVVHAQGDWKVQCQVADHITAGMTALLTVEEGSNEVTWDESSGPVYYIAAQKTQWNYAPSGQDVCSTYDRGYERRGPKPDKANHDAPKTDSGEGHSSDTWIQRSNTTIGSEYTKAVFRQYTDETFRTAVPQPDMMGILGPIIRVNVGEVVTVVLENQLDFDINIELSGLVPISQQNFTTPVPPGGRKELKWYVPLGLLLTNTRVVTMYTSTIDIVLHTNAGLVGMVVITDQLAGVGEVDADEELPLLFMIQNENNSPFLEDNMAASGVNAQMSEEGNLKHCVNGFIFCNMPEVNVTVGERVRWLLMGLGSEADMHTPEFEGQIVQEKGMSVATVELMPAVTKVVDMMAETPGEWLVHCRVQDHIEAGMKLSMTVAEA